MSNETEQAFEFGRSESRRGGVDRGTARALG